MLGKQSKDFIKVSHYCEAASNWVPPDGLQRRWMKAGVCGEQLALEDLTHRAREDAIQALARGQPFKPTLPEDLKQNDRDAVLAAIGGGELPAAVPPAADGMQQQQQRRAEEDPVPVAVNPPVSAAVKANTPALVGPVGLQEAKTAVKALAKLLRWPKTSRAKFNNNAEPEHDLVAKLKAELMQMEQRVGQLESQNSQLKQGVALLSRKFNINMPALLTAAADSADNAVQDAWIDQGVEEMQALEQDEQKALVEFVYGLSTQDITQ